ncbi:MAG TPA: hypothetical protein VMS43_13370 [Allosphingosinicella sp.]|nr:hypothetical protein [Allosphingosinicella sp.]
MVATRKDEASDSGRPEAKTGGGDPPCPPPIQDSSEDPTAFILSRARSEVHLLLDNISANPEVTIATLTTQTKPKGLPKDWIEQVCEITWPPKGAESDPNELAKQAALLIKTRDYLNGLAKPASGSTIAFTLMVTQDTDAKARRRRRSESGAVRTPSRTSLAAEAYPDLVEKARNFRFLLKCTLIFSAGVLLVTLLISWYLAIGNAALTDYAASRTALIEAELRAGAAQAALNVGGGPALGAAQPAPQPAPPPASPATAPQQRQPQSPNQLVQAVPAPTNSYTIFSCTSRSKAYPSAELRDACVARMMHAERFLAVRQGLATWAIAAGPDTAGWLANLLGAGVLPVLYGFLGAIASVVRTLSRKIKASLLSPRDVQLTFQQLALGAVVGACISLFVTPGADNGETSLLGPVALSTSAVSFVAGFGVESVFKALEALISRIFNIAPAGASPSRETKLDS